MKQNRPATWQHHFAHINIHIVFDPTCILSYHYDCVAGMLGKQV